MTDSVSEIAERLRAVLNDGLSSVAICNKNDLRALLDHIERLKYDLALAKEQALLNYNDATGLAMKLDAAEAEVSRLRALIPHEFLLVPPDGGDVHTDEAITAMVAEPARLRKPVEGEVGEVVNFLMLCAETYRRSGRSGEQHQAAADLIQRLAAPVTEGEVKGVVRSLSLIACAPRCEHASECNCTVLDNAADLIQRLAGQVALRTGECDAKAAIIATAEARLAEAVKVIRKGREMVGHPDNIAVFDAFLAKLENHNAK